MIHNCRHFVLTTKIDPILSTCEWTFVVTSYENRIKWELRTPINHLRACETRSQCVSLAAPRAPLKPSLLHSIVFHMLLTVTNEKFLFPLVTTKKLEKICFTALRIENSKSLLPTFHHEIATETSHKLQRHIKWKKVVCIWDHITISLCIFARWTRIWI